MLLTVLSSQPSDTAPSRVEGNLQCTVHYTAGKGVTVPAIGGHDHRVDKHSSAGLEEGVAGEEGRRRGRREMDEEGGDG